MTYPNIVWLLADSIRARPGEEGDIRAKLPFMEAFGRESVEFTTCVTTAPSTVMSVTAMMTGLPAYFLARNYDDFRFDSGYRHSLAEVLKQHGYSSWAFLRGMETREKFKTFLDPVPRRYWPKDLRHGQKWKNSDLDRVLDNVLEAGVPEPAFLFFHYNPRTQVEIDTELSERVEATFVRLVDAGFSRENTIYLLCSDHGYPDSSTGITTEWEVERRLSHDLVLTDDNILIPLYVRYPGCRPKRVETPVSSLDLFPTLLELAGIPEAERIASTTDGASLVPLIDGGDQEQVYPRRFFRCDSRLMLQTARSTAIRSRDFKYIKFHDEHRFAMGNVPQPEAEVLIDLENDPEESRNLIRGEGGSRIKDQLHRFREEFDRTEQRGLEFQIDYLLWRQRRSLARNEPVERGGEGSRILLVFEPETAAYAQIGLRAIHRVHPDACIDVLSDGEGAGREDLTEARHVFTYARTGNGRVRTPSLERGNRKRRQRAQYDLTILFVQKPSNPIVSDLLRIMKNIRAKKRLMLDCNFNAHQRRSYWYYRVRTLLDRLPHMLQEPRIVFDQIPIATALLRRHVMRRLGRWERWEAAETAPDE